MYCVDFETLNNQSEEMSTLLGSILRHLVVVEQSDESTLVIFRTALQ